MYKTGIMWLLLYVGGLSSSFIKGPIFGLLTYMFTFYTQFTWAKSPSNTLGLHRWSMYASIVVLVSYIIKRGNQERLPYFKMPQMKWLILIMVNMLFVSFFAANPAKNEVVIIDFVKFQSLI